MQVAEATGKAPLQFGLSRSAGGLNGQVWPIGIRITDGSF